MSEQDDDDGQHDQDTLAGPDLGSRRPETPRQRHGHEAHRGQGDDDDEGAARDDRLEQDRLKALAAGQGEPQQDDGETGQRRHGEEDRRPASPGAPLAEAWPERGEESQRGRRCGYVRSRDRCRRVGHAVSDTRTTK